VRRIPPRACLILHRVTRVRAGVEGAHVSVVADVFRDHWHKCKDELQRRLPGPVFAAACEIIPRVLRCKTEASGFATLRCACGHTEHVCFTCKARFCPVCGAANAARGAEAAKSRLLNVGHRHMVFTIPEELRPLFFEDRRLLKLLADSAAQALLEVVDLRCKARRLLPGIMCTVQTFGRALNFHPHVHVLVTEGGLQGERLWQPVHHFPALSVCRRFQHHLLSGLRTRFQGNPEVLQLIERCFEQYQGFRVNVMPRYQNAKMAAAYCCRYTGRPPISESRIVGYDGEQVTYWYDDYRTKERVQVTVSAGEFLFLLLQHLPPKHDKTVRYYGLYARRVRRQLFGVVERVSKYDYAVPKGGSRVLRWRDRLIAMFDRDPHRCPECGAIMELVAWHPPPRRANGRKNQEKAPAAPDGQLSLCFV